MEEETKRKEEFLKSQSCTIMKGELRGSGSAPSIEVTKQRSWVRLEQVGWMNFELPGPRFCYDFCFKSTEVKFLYM